jgi:protein translocase SecG subunit
VTTLITVLSVFIGIISVVIVLAVLMQPTKTDSGLGGLGSGVTEQVLGANRNQFLANVTWVLFGLLVVLCLGMGKLSTQEAHIKKNAHQTKSAAEIVLDAKSLTPASTLVTPDAKLVTPDAKPVTP